MSKTVKRYRRLPEDEIPFVQGFKSGSNWDARHLRWIEIDFESNCPVTEIFPSEDRPLDQAKITAFLQQNLAKPWIQIKSMEQFEANEMAYQWLKYLEDLPRQRAAYASSSKHSSSPRAPSSSSPTLPLSFSSPPPLPPLLSSPPPLPLSSPLRLPSQTITGTSGSRRLSQIREIRSSPPLGGSEHGSSSASASPASTPTRSERRATQASRPLPQPANGTSTIARSLHLQDVIQGNLLSSDPADHEYNDNSPQKQRDMNMSGVVDAEDRPEQDVFQAAMAFIEVVKRGLQNVLQPQFDIKLYVR